MTELTRAFVAVEISEGARQKLARLLDRLRRESGTSVRWIKPELMHLTLAFLGEVSQEFIESTKPRLAEVAQQHRAFTMQLEGLGAFPGPSRARVVWVGTEQGREQVCLLQADVVRALSSVGYQPERRPFSPHLTIGRLRVPADVSRSISAEFQSDAFPVNRLVLFRSVLSSAGPTYSVIAEFPLASMSGQPA